MKAFNKFNLLYTIHVQLNLSPNSQPSTSFAMERNRGWPLGGYSPSSLYWPPAVATYQGLTFTACGVISYICVEKHIKSRPRYNYICDVTEVGC